GRSAGGPRGGLRAEPSPPTTSQTSAAGIVGVPQAGGMRAPQADTRGGRGGQPPPGGGGGPERGDEGRGGGGGGEVVAAGGGASCPGSGMNWRRAPRKPMLRLG